MSTNDRDRSDLFSMANFFATMRDYAGATLWFCGVMASPGVNVFKRLGARLVPHVRMAEPDRGGPAHRPWPVVLAQQDRASCWEYERQVATVKVRWRRELGPGDPLMIERPEDVHAVASAIYADLDGTQEHFLLLALNRQNALIGYQVIASGKQNTVEVDVGIFYRSALLLGAVRVIAVHNHPSGLVLPSDGDFLLTRKLARVGTVVGVELAEHLIFTPHSWLSLKELHAGLFGVPAA